MDEWKTRLRQAREAKGLNKTEFARLVGVSNPTVTDWEKAVGDGGIKEIAGGNLTKVCAVLDIDPRWLLLGKESHARAAREEVPLAEPASGQDSRPPDLLNMQAATAAELRMLIVYRSANDREREAIDDVVEEMQLLIEARGRNQVQRTG